MIQIFLNHVYMKWSVTNYMQLLSLLEMDGHMSSQMSCGGESWHCLISLVKSLKLVFIVEFFCFVDYTFYSSLILRKYWTQKKMQYIKFFKFIIKIKKCRKDNQKSPISPPLFFQTHTHTHTHTLVQFSLVSSKTIYLRIYTNFSSNW